MLLIAVVAIILCGIIMLSSGLISVLRSGMIGGFLALFFGIPVIAVGVWMIFGIAFFPGIVHFLGAVLAMVGGLMSIIPSIKRPRKPRSRREHDMMKKR